MSKFVIDDREGLTHWGIKNMRWGYNDGKRNGKRTASKKSEKLSGKMTRRTIRNPAIILKKAYEGVKQNEANEQAKKEIERLGLEKTVAKYRNKYEKKWKLADELRKEKKKYGKGSIEYNNLLKQANDLIVSGNQDYRVHEYADTKKKNLDAFSDPKDWAHYSGRYIAKRDVTRFGEANARNVVSRKINVSVTNAITAVEKALKELKEKFRP